MENGKQRIDFNLVKDSVSMEMLIVYLGLYPLRRKGAEVRLKCPFHNGKSDNSMTIYLNEDRFYCFGCKRRGGIIDFVALYENCTFFDAAALLDKWFRIEMPIEEGGEAEADDPASVEITPAHLIASIELQLAQLKRLLISR